MKSILISCATRLAPFDIKELRELTEYDEMDIEDIGETKTALFMIMSDTDSTFNFLMAMLEAQLFNILCDIAGEKHGGKLPIHVRFILDEFANIGKIPDFEKIISVNSLKKEINPVSLEYASLLHDVGKLGVPEAILNKPGKLTDEEWKIMYSHPETGIKILKPLKTFSRISDWILYHHERIDGKGYYKIPDEKIPLAARIIAIADTYSAITMRRSYKEPRTHADAMRIIQEVAGKQLDADLVKIFMTIPEEELKKCIPEQVKY